MEFAQNHLKHAIIKPSFKKGGKSQVSIYRPISLLTGFSKLFELLIFYKLKHHLVSNDNSVFMTMFLLTVLFYQADF